MRRTIDERTEFLLAVSWTPEQMDEIERIEQWIRTSGLRPAEYIVWLESQER